MRFFQKTKGAISLFLVIILVPMMTLSALYVDASKVSLGKALAESAGDLTLNTALTNYDTDLKELYGLMATAQDTDDLFGKLEDYYRTCIISSGVGEDEADTYVGQIMAQLGIVAETNETSDIMNMELVDFAVEKYSDANLANATMLEKQIVDFMKYRAPINTGLSFVSSLKSFSTLSKQTELVEKKQEYYKAQQGVMESLQKAWEFIAKYNSTNIVQKAEHMSEVLSSLGNMKDGTHGYKQLHGYMVKDLYHVGEYISENDIRGYINYNVDVEKVGALFTITKGNSSQGGIQYDYVPNTNPPTEYHFGTVYSNFQGAVSAEKTAYDTFEPLETTDYELQYLVQYRRNNGEPLDVYTQQMIQVQNWYLTLQELYNLLSRYDDIWLAKAQEIYDKEDRIDQIDDELAIEYDKETEERDEDKINELEAEKLEITNVTIPSLEYELENTLTAEKAKDTLKIGDKTIRTVYDEVYATYSAEMQKFMEVANRFSEISVRQMGIYGERYKITDVNVRSIATEINDYVNELQNSSDYLETASKHLEDARKSLADGGDVANARREWDDVSKDDSISGTNLAKQNQDEIAQLDTYLTANNVNKLKERLDNIKKEIDDSIKQIKDYKYCNEFIGNIDSYDDMEEAIKNFNAVGNNALENVTIDKNGLEIQTTTWWNSCWQDGGLDFGWMNSLSPDLTKNKCSMYSYLYSHFAAITTVTETGTETQKADGQNLTTATGEATADDTNGKNFYENIQNVGESEAGGKASGTDSAQAGGATEGNNISELSNLPSSKATDGSETPSGSTDVDNDTVAASTSSSLGKLFNDENGFLSAITNMAEDLRDKLYVSDYAMSMFSYDTIENEYRVKNEMDKEAEISSGTLLTLTKNDLSATNNYAYGAEVEYIIYGGTNSDNLTKAYGTIYGIRFGFNLIYAFATSEIRDSALAIATPISAATLGVIPVPLIQAAIIIALACCESAVDLVDIRDGHQIPLYKSKKTWVCSVTGLTKKAKDAAGTVIREHTNALVDSGINKLNEVLDMTDDEINNLLADGKTDISESVENAYNQLITENANAAIQTFTTFVTEAIESVRCLDADEEYTTKKEDVIKNKLIPKLRAWGNVQSGSDLASRVKAEAVNAILANDAQLVYEMFDIMESSILSTEYGATIDNILAVDEKVVGEELSELGGAIMDKITQVRTSISFHIANYCDDIKTKKTEAINSVKAALQKESGVLKEELNNAINGCLDDLCGPDGTGGDGGVSQAGLCSFTYSDYLRLFTLIGLYANEEKVVLRIGDVIQANLAKGAANKGDDYQLSKSATYVKISAEVQVKPTFLALPLFANVENNPNTDSSWYTFEYSGMAGY